MDARAVKTGSLKSSSRGRMIPITTVKFGHEEEQLVLEVLRSGSIAQGPKVAQLEKRFAELFNVPHAIAVNNGTTALVAALQVLDLKPGDEVITSPFTFVATLNAILEAGATATFADIRDDDFNIDPQSVAERITDRTKVLLPVHLYGQMADMTPLAGLAATHDLRILEDAAQSHGATYDGRHAGSYGLGTFSLYATKNITTGEGGLITTDDAVLADRLRVLRNQGMRARYVYEMAGNNYRLTDLQAAIGIPQLERYESIVTARRRNADRLIEGLSDVPGIVVPRELEGRGHVWHQFTIRVTEEAGISRDTLVEELTARGIGSGIYYPKLVFDYDAYRTHPRVAISDVPVAARIVTEVVSLPVHTALSDSDLTEIISAVRTAAGA
ncbi:DegT/DnrJ/EryC1/StrS family aminotransferase [Glaciibacter psychrotolerans]|uniref:dTDP-4-amino-4,6-dideoxygalactose transaminase n=1 Tax=Glaciibacter psychrotolerans TaxID=670054 RepID=A0A7Z0EFZ2_9MICO|nr:DegT/DnrJ/EryC1/StrS family aminotransferase [Leifsonia psychrotolerans]NYJ20234.1 dTDP-4-amino-4,6-dideoxygalactose transaminase [Leifsonia psychrotolerans]